MKGMILGLQHMDYSPLSLNISMPNHTTMERKENVKMLFFSQSTMHWHFDELVKQSKLSRAQVNAWLKRLLRERLIKKIQPKGKMPYYISDWESSAFRVQKRLFALIHLEKAGFLEHLYSLKGAKTVVIFGSFARADWHDASDIDIFIYGKDDKLELGKYEKLLKREIQVFTAENSKGLQKMGPGLLRSIASGYFVKGGMDFMEVKANA